MYTVCIGWVCSHLKYSCRWPAEKIVEWLKESGNDLGGAELEAVMQSAREARARDDAAWRASQPEEEEESE